MAFAIQHYNPTTGTTLVYQHIALKKVAGRGIRVPQLFYNKRPILYGLMPSDPSSTNSPKVGSTKWMSFSTDNTKAINHYYIDEYDLGGFGDTYRILPKLTNYIQLDNSSGLTVSVAGMKNNDGTTWANSALRITRSSISTNYLNVFTWAWFDASVGQPGFEMGQWSNDANYMNPETSTIYYHKEFSVLSGEGTSGKIDNSVWRCIHRWVTISKSASSSTYLYIAAPWADTSMTAAPLPEIRGWGMILEPTNSNTYPPAH